MTTQEATVLSESALTRLMNALEQGQSDALKLYLSIMSRFHRYSWGNSLLIYAQRPNATHVAGFHAWLKFNRFVRKGEKGIVILAPMLGKKKSVETEPRENESSDQDEARLFGFRAVHVFDISQTDGEPLPEFARVQGDPSETTDRLKAFVFSKSIALQYDDRIRPAHGVSAGGKITLLTGLSAAEEFSVLVHETVHELLHRGVRRSETSHTVRETEAEAVAFVVCSAIGLETGTAGSDYIQLHRGDKTTLSESLGFIQRTAMEILQAIHSDVQTNDDTR